MSFLQELKRRNVFRVTLAYVVVSWVLLQVGDVVFDFLDLPDSAGRFLIAIIALGAIPTVFFSWAYEITPEGVKKESEVIRDESITRVTAKKLDLMTMVMVALGIGFLLVDRFVLEPRITTPDSQARPDSATVSSDEPIADSAVPENSIAVLPFVNMSPDKDNEYFSDGISEELLNLLAKIPDFQVTGRTSSFAFKDENQDLREIGEKLGVRHILEGSVRKSGQQVRVTAQLVLVDDGFHLWSDTYDRELNNIFVIQDEIAASVVKALKVTLLGEPQKNSGSPGQQVSSLAGLSQPAPRPKTPVTNTQAYELVLKGRYHWHQRTGESLQQSIRYFQQAIELDPTYAPAYTGLSDAFNLANQYGELDLKASNEASKAVLQKAFELAPDSGDTWASQGLLELQLNDRPAAKRSLEKAIAFNPSHAMAYNWLGNAEIDPRRALDAYEKARQLDPLHPTVLSNIALTLTNFGRYDEALQAAKELIEMHPKRGAQSSAAVVSLRAGRIAESVHWSLAAWRTAPDRVLSYRLMPLLFISIGEQETAEKWLQYGERIAPGDIIMILSRGWAFEVNNDLEGLLSYWSDRFDRYGQWVDKAEAALAHLRLKDYKAAREAYEDAFLINEAVTVTPENMFWMVDYAVSLKNTGDPRTADRILSQALSMFLELKKQGVIFESGYIDGHIAAILAQQGKISESLDALRRAYQAGAKNSFFFQNAPSLEPLQDNLGFVQLIAAMDQHTAAERAILAAQNLIAGPEELTERGWEPVQ